MELPDLDTLLSNLNKDLALTDNADFKSHCQNCKLPVIGDAVQFCQDEIKYFFHKECFLCCCGEKLNVSDQFYLHQSKPTCKKCYSEKILGKCDKCNNAIEGTITKANGKQFHLTCFTCKHCEVVLSSKYYATPENDLYCKVCHEEIMLPTCCKCNEKILAVADESSAEGKNTITTIVFKEKKYHESCFKCQECRKEFKDMKVYCVEENILCQHCYNCRINARAKELAAELK